LVVDPNDLAHCGGQFDAAQWRLIHGGRSESKRTGNRVDTCDSWLTIGRLLLGWWMFRVRGTFRVYELCLSKVVRGPRDAGQWMERRADSDPHRYNKTQNHWRGAVRLASAGPPFAGFSSPGEQALVRARRFKEGNSQLSEPKSELSLALCGRNMWDICPWTRRYMDEWCKSTTRVAGAPPLYPCL
jgi:hypothetical protein